VTGGGRRIVKTPPAPLAAAYGRRDRRENPAPLNPTARPVRCRTEFFHLAIQDTRHEHQIGQVDSPHGAEHGMIEPFESDPGEGDDRVISYGVQLRLRRALRR
jgi:hypothetical protein